MKFVLGKLKLLGKSVWKVIWGIGEVLYLIGELIVAPIVWIARLLD